MNDRPPFAPQSELFPRLSHQVRQPLNGVIEALAALEALSLPNHQRRYVGGISRAAHDLVMLINDVLDLTRIEEGNFRLLPADFDLRGALKTVGERLERHARADARALTTRLHAEVPVWVWGDPGRFKHILADLGDAALALTRSPALFLDVELESETPREYILVISIDDPGTTPLRNAQLTLSSGKPGVFVPADLDPAIAIRLTLVRSIITLMGGTCGVEPSETQGGSFWIRLPIEKRQPAREPAIETALELQGLRVLFYDDTDAGRARLAELLRSWGCVVTATGDFAEAAKALDEAQNAELPIQLVVFSATTTGQAAEDFGRRLRADDATRRTPLLLITAAGKRGDAARLREIGFDAYLTTPLYDTYLRQALSLLPGRVVSGDMSSGLVTRHSLREMARRDRRVLVADPDELHQMIVVRSVEKTGWSAESVSDWGLTARALESETYDVAFVSTKLLDSAARMWLATRRRETNIPIPPMIALFDPIEEPEAKLLDLGFAVAVARPASPARVAEALARFDESPPDRAHPVSDLLSAKNALLRELDELLVEFDHDKDLLSEVGRHFRETVDAAWPALQKSIEDKDPERFVESADRLLIAAYSMGIPRFQAAFENLHDLGRHGRWTQADDAQRHARRLFGLIEQWIEKL
ncbi:MAG: hypothetical protein IT350_17925 [Deltaproteobacteria bacterium]|nr:hypothetical protein [Deltaproteobacteria bacterium]